MTTPPPDPDPEIPVLLRTATHPDGIPVGVWPSLAAALAAAERGLFGPIGPVHSVERDYGQ
jgi:hypothetical protein